MFLDQLGDLLLEFSIVMHVPDVKFFVFRGISNEEKAHLRQKLLSHLREENYQVLPVVSFLVLFHWNLIYRKWSPRISMFNISLWRKQVKNTMEQSLKIMHLIFN